MNQVHGTTLQKTLLAWFDAHGRSLPWRHSRSLYGTWVSEIMLQQTSVAVVIPFWEKFMLKFPDVQALAAASESEVLATWSGLGYYRRARNLHRAARMVAGDLGGQLPNSRQQWQELPGVGVYASGAIASIGLGEVVPAMDGNARRVLSRWHLDDPVAAGNLRPAELEKMGAAMVSVQRPGDWNEAVMELGATLCQAGAVRCAECPVLDQCRAGLAGIALEIPPSRKMAPAIPIAMAILVVRCGEKFLLLPPDQPELVRLTDPSEVGRENTSGLHQGLWTLPASPWYLKAPSVLGALEKPDFVGNWLENFLELSPADVQKCSFRTASFSHSITKYRLNIRVWDVQLPKNLKLPKWDKPQPGYFVSSRQDCPVSKLVSKSLEFFDSGIV